jgi:hypothetical protein
MSILTQLLLQLERTLLFFHQVAKICFSMISRRTYMCPIKLRRLAVERRLLCIPEASGWLQALS